MIPRPGDVGSGRDGLLWPWTTLPLLWTNNGGGVKMISKYEIKPKKI